MTDLQTAVARAQDHLHTVSDDLSIANLAGDLSKCRAAVAAAMATVNSVAGDLATIAALVPAEEDEPAEEIVAAFESGITSLPTVTPLATQ
jgi:hypothetical protein